GWAAGVMSVMYALLAMRHGVVPHQCFVEPTRARSRERAPIEPIRPTPTRPVTVGVSAFGVGGANAHAVLPQPAPRPQAQASQTPRPQAQANPALPDPMVLVGWSAALPGDPPRTSVIASLSCGVDPSHSRRFDDSLTPPGFAESRLPPEALRAIDRGQWL